MVGGGRDLIIAKDQSPMVNYMLKVREEHAKKQKKDYSHVFRSKSRLDFIRLSAILIGIEFAYAAETAFVSPILLQIGIEHSHMTMVWCLSPVLGFFLAPLLGSLSDRCRLNLGRRRPVIMLLSLGILLGLLLVPYGKDLGLFFGDVGAGADVLVNSTDVVASSLPDENYQGPAFGDYKFAAVLTILGTILLDFDADTCQIPSRAYLLDVCIPDDHAKALSTFTIMAGLGGTVGYALGAINWKVTSIGSFLGGNIPTVFTIVTVVFIICFIITIVSFREIPLKLMEKDELLRPLSAAAIKKESSKNTNTIYYIKETTSLELKISEMESNKIKPPQFQLNGNFDNSINKCENGGTDSISTSTDEDETQERISLGQYLKSIVIMPKSMRILSLTNLLCWMGHVCYCLYFTDFVGEAVFGGDPTAPVNSEAYDLYDEGVRYGCWGMSIYAFSCSIYSVSVEKLMKVLGIRIVYVGGILVYAIGMLILAIWPTKIGVLVLSSCAGVIYATIFTMPYILVAQYHQKGCFKIKSGENVPLKQSRGLGTDLAIVSSMVFIAQFIISLSVGALVTLLGSTSAVLYTASAVSICAAISAMFVLYL